MSEKETKRRLIAASVLIWTGLFVIICATGRLDYLNEQHITYGIEEQWSSLVKGGVGLLLMIAGMFVGRDLEFEDGESEVDEDDGE